MAVLLVRTPKELDQSTKDNYMAKVGKVEFCKRVSPSKILPIKSSSRSK